MKEAVKLVDHAAQRDDRWLMVALLFAVIAGVGLAVRWLATHVERIEARYSAERDAILANHAAERERIISAYRAERQDRFKAMCEQTDKLGVIVKENTQIITRVLERL